MKVSFEKALKEEKNVFELTKLVIHRAKKISYDGSIALTSSLKQHKPAVIALMEIDEELISLDAIKEDIKSQLAIQDSMREIENMEDTQKIPEQNLDEILPSEDEIIIAASGTQDNEENKETKISSEDELEEEVIEEIHSHDQ